MCAAYKNSCALYEALANVCVSYEGMMRLMENAKPYNATVTLSDNYDDGIGAVLAGTRILLLDDRMESCITAGPGPEYYAIRNDWDRKNPASGYVNLVKILRWDVWPALGARGTTIESHVGRHYGELYSCECAGLSRSER